MKLKHTMRTFKDNSNCKIFRVFFHFLKKKLTKLLNFATKNLLKKLNLNIYFKKTKKNYIVPMSESSGHPALTHHSSCLVSQKEQPQGPRNSPRTFLPARQNLGSLLSLFLSGGSSLEEAAVCIFRAFASLACCV